MKIPRTELFLMENDDERINGKRIISDEHSTDIEETSLSLSLCRVAGRENFPTRENAGWGREHGQHLFLLG